MSMELSIYHEQQLSALCGVHALNNLLQGPYCGAGDLAAIAHDLDAAERDLRAALSANPMMPEARAVLERVVQAKAQASAD